MTDPERHRAPADPRDPSGFGEAERARAARTLARRLQAGGIAFLVVLALGMLPRILGAISPDLGRAATVAAWVGAPLVVLGLLAFAALRLRR